MVSVLVEVVGLIGYLGNGGGTMIVFTPQWRTGGSDFFTYARTLILSLFSGVNAVSLMALGIVLLMLTPYLRVVTSVVYFGSKKDLKYTVITATVLAILTLSLALH